MLSPLFLDTLRTELLYKNIHFIDLLNLLECSRQHHAHKIFLDQILVIKKV